MKKNCKICEKEFIVKPYRAKAALYCSSKCYGLSKASRPSPLNKKVTKTCLECGLQFKVSPYRRGIARYCSRTCTYLDHGRKVSGEKSGMWKGGPLKTGQGQRATLEYKNWRIEVFRRDKFTCQMCYIVGKNLNANHIKKWSDYPALRFDINNGVTLCKDCHGKITWHEDLWEKYFRFTVGTWKELYV